MTKRKKSTRKATPKRYKKSATKQTSSIDVTVISLIILSILLGILIYGKAGIVGIKLSEVLGGMMGIIEYILPIAVFFLGINIALDSEENTTSKLTQGAFLLINLSILMSIFQINSNKLIITNKELSAIVKDAYALGINESGGGVLGAIIAVPLTKLFSPTGAIVICIGIIAILLIFILNINISDKINEYSERKEIDKEIRSEEREANKEERKKQRQEELERKQKERMEKALEKENARKVALEMPEKTREPEQIKINYGGKIIEGKEKIYTEHENNFERNRENNKNLKEDNFENQRANNFENSQENSLFKQEEEKKEDKTKEVLQLEHSMMVEDENYEYPPITLLQKAPKKTLKGGTRALKETADKLQKTLYSFGVHAKVEDISVGPAITRYELKPEVGVRVSKIANLADDIALNLAAESIRIEAPIPGKQAVGIEVPNKEKESVPLREVLESDEFQDSKSKLTVALGKDVAGNTQLADIAKMPHLLIAGATGSGKSVCINTIITSIIFKSKPSEVKMVMIDPKVVELSVYNGIPHLLIPVVTDPKKAAGALAWAVQEMDDRYNKFAQKGVRDLKGYNKAIEKEGEGLIKMPQIVIIVDELADLMMVASKEVEEAICRLAQKARAAGMHLVIATQRPSVDVITGLIKANIPSRIAFSVSSQIDSRTILDMTGAEKLLGKGDMLFYPSGASKPVRVQGAFVSDEEVESIVDFVKQNGTATYSEDILETIENSGKTEKEINEETEDDDTDPFLMDAIEAVVEQGQASTSFVQRKFKVGYARAGRIIDQMEERGIISGYQGSKPREVLITKERWEELKAGTKPETQEETD